MQNARRSPFLRPPWLLLPLLFILSACAPSSGIFASSSWQVGTLQKEHIRSLAVDPNNAQNVYAGDAQHGVFASADGGTSWKQQQNGLPSGAAINALVFDDPGKKLYAASDAGVYVSVDGAKSWAKVDGLAQDKYTSIAFDLKKTQSIYVGSEQHGVFASSNSGATWTAANSGLPANLTVHGLAFDSDAHQLWAATSMGVYRSPDGGASWQALNSGLPADVTVYAILPASSEGGAQGLIYAGTNKGLFLSHDAAMHWQTSQTPLGLISIYGVLLDYHTVTTVYISTGNVGILRSLDSGVSWGEVATGLPSHQTVYAMAQGAANYDQLFAAINNVYLYPGTSTIFDPTRLLPFLLIIAFFYLLFRMTARRLNASRNMLKPERVIEPENVPSPGETDNSPANGENKSDNSG
jgi:ligand-binding sensor domain-containing protein